MDLSAFLAGADPVPVIIVGSVMGVLIYAVRTLLGYLLKEKDYSLRSVAKQVKELDELTQIHDTKIALLEQDHKQIRDFLAEMKELPGLVKVLNVEIKHLSGNMSDIRKKLDQ